MLMIVTSCLNVGTGGTKQSRKVSIINKGELRGSSASDFMI